MAAGTGAAPAALYLGLCRLRGILSPPALNDYAAGGLFIVVATMVLHRFASLGLKSRIDARKSVNREKLASIRKFGPEIMNRCTQQGVNGENLALILKFGPEIENRCTNQPIFSTQPQHIPQHAFITR